MPLVSPTPPPATPPKPTTSAEAPAADVSGSRARAVSVPTVDWNALKGDIGAARQKRDEVLSGLPPVSGRFNNRNPVNAQIQEKLQTRLNELGVTFEVPQTGVFDAKTEEAVRLLQGRAGITIDGCIGQQTWSVLLGCPPELRPPQGIDLLDTTGLSALSATDRSYLLGFEGARYGLDASAFEGLQNDYALLGQQPDGHNVRMALRSLALRMGMRITAEGDGRHSANSWHYKEDAHGTSMGLDVAGTPEQMAQYTILAKTLIERSGFTVKELFYDRVGGIKNGQSVGAIGGHGDHVHVAV